MGWRRRFAKTAIPILVLGGLVAGHVLARHRGDAYAGPWLILDHLYALALVLGLFALGAGLGGRLLGAAGLDLETPLETLLFWTATGLGVLATALLLAGLALGVRPLVLLAVLAGGAAIGRRELRQVPALARDALASLRAGADRFSLSVLLLVALYVVTGALLPATDWDSLMYHLRIPQQFLQAGAIYLPEDNAHFAFIGLPHMLYLPLLALADPAGPALVSALCTLGLGLAAFAFSLRFLDRRTAGFSLAVLWGSVILALVAISPRVDTILAFYLFLVQYAVIWAKQKQDPRLLYLAAALAGMAIGVKDNALVYLLVLAPLGVWVVVTPSARPRRAVALMLGLALVTALPWLLKNALLLGNPVYPFLSGFRLDPWLARIYHGAASRPPMDPATFTAIWQTQKPFNLVDLFLAPERITVEAEGTLYRPNLLLLALPLWFWFRNEKALGRLAGPALAYVVGIVVLQPRTSLRYLIPAIAPLTLVALYCYGRVWDKVLSPGRVRLLLAATALLLLTGMGRLAYWGATTGRQLAYASGAISRQDVLRAYTRDYADIVSVIDTGLPPHSLVLMLFEARGYYFRVPVLQDNAIDNWPLLAPRAAAPDCLRGTGITHVLLNVGALQLYQLHGVDLRLFQLDAFRRFAHRCLTPFYSHGGYALFQVHPGGVSPGDSAAAGPPTPPAAR